MIKPYIYFVLIPTVPREARKDVIKLGPSVHRGEKGKPVFTLFKRHSLYSQKFSNPLVKIKLYFLQKNVANVKKVVFILKIGSNFTVNNVFLLNL